MRKRLAGIGNRIMRDIRRYGRGLAAAVILYFIMHRLFRAFCPSILITGFSCPGCGMTRAVLCLLKGQVARAWTLNPAAGLWILWAAWFAVERYGRGRRPKALIRAALGILLFMVLVYIIRMKLYFPDKPPYTYRGNNLFSRMLPGYDKVIRHLTTG